ncbi:hypothetical protein PHMEG_00037410 [Phytophthora megakarya]|uniref:Uncharacterized protein n=1 Tax=Phytophthora megakarya TaxID=4795 RepID=A0A225UJZ2_9STRA|nr:hypothetical protein PHMEG_00037410 [Phytophthora megakarya]
MKHPSRGKDATTDFVNLTQAAEFEVLSSITVREEYKTKLRDLLSIISPSSFPEAVNTNQKNTPQFKLKTSKSVGYLSPEVTEGKELHVLGDLLLLVRAASVDVVENIQVWREVVHQGIPRPYIYEHENYLLRMCEDLDFLDKVEDLVEWLGFRLLRNPFIVDKALDDIVSSRLGVNVHADRSLKYWNSLSWRKNTKLSNKQGIVIISSKSTTIQSKPAVEVRWKKRSPPLPLVTPLASISPEDDVVDGSRITTAQKSLLDEESFHGRVLALKVAHDYVDRGPSKFECGNIDNKPEPSAVYAAIATVDSQRKISYIFASA